MQPKVAHYYMSRKIVDSTLSENEKKIVDELNAAQGSPVDIGGYYHPDTARVAAEMRPSATFNAALEGLGGEA